MRDVAEAADIEAGFANHLADGPGGPRPRAGRPCRTRSRSTARRSSTRSSRTTSASRPTRARGSCAGARGAGRLAAHGREPVGRDAARGPARAHVPRPAGRRRAHVRAARPDGGRGRAATAWCAGSSPRSATGFDPRPREAIDRALRPAPRRAARPARSSPRCAAATTPRGIDVGAPDALAAIDPTAQPRRLLRRQADRLEGRRPAARGLAAGAGARAPTRKLVVVGFGTYREGLEVLLRGLERDDERLLMHVCRQGRALEGGPRDQLTYLRTFLESLAGRHERYFAAAQEDARERSCSPAGSSTASSARLLPSAEAVGRAEHVPRGVRDGRRRGRGLRRAAGLRRPLGPRRGGERSSASRCRPRCAQLLTFERGMRAVEGLAAAMIGWLELDERLRRLGARGARAHGRRRISAGSRWPRTSVERREGPHGGARAGPGRGSVLGRRLGGPGARGPICSRDSRSVDMLVYNLASIVTNAQGGCVCRFGMGCRASC